MGKKVKNSSLWQTFGDVLQQYSIPMNYLIFQESLETRLVYYTINIYIYIYDIMCKYIYICVKLKFLHSHFCHLSLPSSSWKSSFLLANQPPAYRLGIPNQAVAACNPMTLEIIHRPRWRETPLPILRISGKWEWYWVMPADTLPETNSSHLKMGAPWKRRSLLETISFRCYVSFRECR